MASRVVSQQHKGVAVVPVEDKQKKIAGAQGRNRQALGDIGNRVSARAVDVKPPITRPVTRSFCAQLLANAQAAAAENNKKSLCVNLDGAKRVPKQKKIGVKPKPEELVIHSKEEEVKKEEKLVVVKAKKTNSSSSSSSSRKGNFHSLSSVLTARSKYACGIKSKPKENITDIDAPDAENELAAVEYVEDIYNFYKQIENESQPSDYMDSQPEMNEKMRAILVDWLIEVHLKFELVPETLYLTINIIDRFLAKTFVPRKHLQLVGIGAMLTAAKYEEIWSPQVNDFVCIADSAYTHGQILAMEKTILGDIEWTLTVPTLYVFLVRFIKASMPEDQKMENMVYFLAELGMMHYATIKYYPSMIAASAVYAAQCTLNKTPVWSATLEQYTGFSETQLSECAKLLVGFHQMTGESKLKVVQRKYSNPELGAVALLPPAKNLLA